MALIRLPWQNGQPEPVPRHIPGTPIHQIVSLIPVTNGRRNDLDRALADVRRATAEGPSSLRDLPQVHMIRIEVIDTLPVGGRRPRQIALDVPIVLFGATFEGNTSRLARSLIDAAPDPCDAIFGCCLNYPGKDRVKLGAWFRAYEITPNLPFSARTASRQRIEQSFTRTDNLRRFMTSASSLEPAQLKAAFLQGFS